MHLSRLIKPLLLRSIIPKQAQLTPPDKRTFIGKMINGTEFSTKDINLEDENFITLLGIFNPKKEGTKEVTTVITHSPFEDFSRNTDLALINSKLPDVNHINPLHTLKYVSDYKRSIYNLGISPWIRITNSSAITFEAFLQQGGRDDNHIFEINCMIEEPSVLKRDEEIMGFSFNKKK